MNQQGTPGGVSMPEVDRIAANTAAIAARRARAELKQRLRSGELSPLKALADSRTEGSPASTLRVTIVERPAVGSVRVLDRPGERAELVHLASHRAAAAEWLARHGYPNAVMEEVTADEAAADAVEGRAVA